jgi:hypothetical protein
VVTTEHSQVFFGREGLDEDILLQGNSKPGSHRAGIASDIDPENADRAAARPRDTVNHAQRGGFPGAVWTQKAKTHAGRNLEAQVIHRQPEAKAFRNRGSLNNHGVVAPLLAFCEDLLGLATITERPNLFYQVAARFCPSAIAALCRSGRTRPCCTCPWIKGSYGDIRGSPMPGVAFSRTEKSGWCPTRHRV